MANDGQPYENSYVWIVRLRDGEVVDGTAFYDSISFNDLWGRVNRDLSRQRQARVAGPVCGAHLWTCRHPSSVPGTSYTANFGPYGVSDNRGSHEGLTARTRRGWATTRHHRQTRSAFIVRASEFACGSSTTLARDAVLVASRFLD